MDTTYLELAEACRQSGAVGVQGLALFAKELGADRVAQILRRKTHLLETAQLLCELAPHQRVVTDLVRVGRLADFPSFTSNLTTIAIGGQVLARGELLELFPGECNVRFAQRGNGRASVWVDRDCIVGLEKTAPSLWESTISAASR